MKFSFALAASVMLCLLTSSRAAVSIGRANSLLNKMEGSSFPDGAQLVETLQERVIEHGKCNPHVCFALDGSGSLSDDDFQLQKEFVQLVSAVIGVDRKAKFAAVQYGLRLKRISRLTRGIKRFLLRVDKTKKIDASMTFIAAGLAFCISEFDRKADGQPQKIVLLGDGFSNFGGNPVPVAQKFLNKGPETTICAIGVGFASINALTQITGDPSRVLTVDDWDVVTRIMRELVEDICELPPLTE